MTEQRHRFSFDPERVTLPKGTRVVLKVDRQGEGSDGAGRLCKAGTVGVVVEVAYDNYQLRTAAGALVRCQRDQLRIQKHDQLPAIAKRQASFERLEGRVFYSAVVGSTAWGLASESSDVDLRGVFLLPFDDWAGLARPIEEIADPEHDTQYWELQKLLYLALRADAGALELLWSPEVRVMDELGERLRDQRRCFVSRQVFGTFGRYAISQFAKMRRAERRVRTQQLVLEVLDGHGEASDEALLAHLAEALVSNDGVSADEAPVAAQLAIRDLYRSLYDKGLLEERGLAPLRAYIAEHASDVRQAEAPRWKNAYNLLRLLHSGRRWLEEGEPLIRCEGAIRDELLAVKGGQWSLAQVLERADELSAALEEAYAKTTLPEEPDYEAAETLLIEARRGSVGPTYQSGAPASARAPSRPPRASEKIRASGESPDLDPPLFEIPRAALEAFLGRYDHLDIVICGLVGSHSYGFPSRDSDFDLKAMHLAPAEAFSGLDEPQRTVDFLDMVDGLEIDFTSHEARFALERLLRGDGNVLERILSPYAIGLEASSDEAKARLAELQALTRENLHRGFFRHYAGFLRGMEKQHDKERQAAAAEGAPEHQARIKTLLYMFRVALTGLHLLKEGELVADLRALLPRYPQPGVEELLARKAAEEKGTMDDARPYLALLPGLFEALHETRERSPLPEEAPAKGALDAWLRRWRQTKV